MDKEALKEMMGLKGGETPSLRLNEVSLNGDTGKFNLIDLVKGKGEDGKYPTEELGESVKGVILKMRWRYFKIEPDGAGYKVTSSSEYDDKRTDEVVIFSEKDRGLAMDMKEKYDLSTQRVIYTYLPDYKQIVRLIVKSSALDGEKNPNGEMGLFDYQNAMEDALELPIDFITEFGAVQREERVKYYAMTFKKARELTETERAKCVDMLMDVHSKTKQIKIIASEQQLDEVHDAPVEEKIERPKDDIDPDDIPF